MFYFVIAHGMTHSDDGVQKRQYAKHIRYINKQNKHELLECTFQKVLHFLPQVQLPDINTPLSILGLLFCLFRW